MSHTKKTWVFLFLFFISATSFSAELTENSVKNLLSEIDNAIVNLDANGVANALSDDVNITMNITMEGQTQVMKLSKQEYITMLKQGWSAYENYTYSKSNVIIKIQEGKAIVTANIKETMTVQGQNLSGESQEIVTIEIVNGNLLITNVVGYTAM